MTQANDPSPVMMNFGALVAILLGVTVITLDISLTSTAIPAIAKGLDVPATQMIWIINIYYLAVIAALLPLAALGEIYGHRLVFLAGLGLFAVGAVMSGLADSLWVLMAGRSLLAIGSAAVSATTPAMIRTLYPPEKLGRGLGLYAMIVGIAFTVGPTATSAVLSLMEWHWLFLLSAPLALVALTLGVSSLPSTERNVRPFDPASAVLCAAMFACLLFGIAGFAHMGWKVAGIAFAFSLAFGYGLRQRESSKSAPILAVDLFRIPLFALSAVTSICAFTVQGLVFVVLPFLFMFKMGYSQIEAGLLITPWPTALVLMTLVAPRLAERIAPGILGAGGLLLLAVGLGLLATMSASASIYDIGWRLLICGIGFGFFQSPNMVALMSSAPKERSGGAGGILATSRLLGQSIGAAAVAFCLSTWPMHGVTTVIWLGAVLATIGGTISLARMHPSVRQLA